MILTWLWTRHELRRRWRRLLVLALLVAVASGTVLTAWAGAHRASTSVDRLLALTAPADAIVPVNTPDFDWEPYDDLPYVEALGVFTALDFYSEDLEIDDWAFHDPTGVIYSDALEKPVVLEGRMYDAAEPYEVVVTPWFVEETGKGVGDTLDIRFPTPDQMAAVVTQESFDRSAYAGSEVTLTIVGVVRSGLLSDTPENPRGRAATTPALISAHPEGLMTVPGGEGRGLLANAVLRFENGAADIPRFRRDLARISGRPDIDVWDVEERFVRPAEEAVTFEARALAAFGGAAFVAALFLVGQAVSRATASSGDELAPARALGMTPWQRVVAAGLPTSAASAVGAILGAGLAVVASRWFPVGTAATLEPDPGTELDVLVLAPGLAGAVLLGVLFSAVGAARQSRAAGSEASGRASVLATAAARGSAPVPLVIGTRFALEAGRGRRSVPVRPALLGAVVGVLGVVAAFVFSHGIDDAIRHPERFGQTHEASAFVGFGGEHYSPVPVHEMVSALTALDYVDGVNDARQGVATAGGEGASVTLWSYDSTEKPLATVVTDGRMPVAADEVLLASATAELLDAAPGDRVELTGDAGTKAFRVTGVGFVPVGAHNGYTDGGWVTERGYDSILSDYKFREVLVSAGGADPVARLTKDLAELTDQGIGFVPASTTQTVEQLREVRRLPVFLGAFLALLAVGAVGHALVTAVRRRAHDLAVLRAVGGTPGQSRWIVAVQATVVVAIGLAFGVPLGLAAGRSLWRVVAEFTPLDYVPPTAVVALALVGPAALLLAYAIATGPAVRASRIRVAVELRAE